MPGNKIRSVAANTEDDGRSWDQDDVADDWIGTDSVTAYWEAWERLHRPAAPRTDGPVDLRVVREG